MPGTTFSRMGRSVSGTEKLGGLRRYSPSAIRSRMSACFFRTALACWNRKNKFRKQPQEGRNQPLTRSVTNRVKGTGSQDEYLFWSPIKLIIYFMSMRDCMVFKFLVKEKILLAFMKTFTNSMNWFGSRINFCNGFPLCHWSIFSSVHPLLDEGKICGNNWHVLVGFRYDFSVPARLFMVKIAASEYLKRVTIRIIRISK